MDKPSVGPTVSESEREGDMLCQRNCTWTIASWALGPSDTVWVQRANELIEESRAASGSLLSSHTPPTALIGLHYNLGAFKETQICLKFHVFPDVIVSPQESGSVKERSAPKTLWHCHKNKHQVFWSVLLSRFQTLGMQMNPQQHQVWCSDRTLLLLLRPVCQVERF